MLDYDPNKETLPYTIALIKPDTVLQREKVQEILTRIEDEGFAINNMLQRFLTKEEVQNVFFKHLSKDYLDKILVYMLSGEAIVLLLTNQVTNPIEKWKKLVGPMDPNEAKKTAPNSLRAKYGFDLIRNELHGSDNPREANKERDIFNFPIPQKIPEFQFNKFKVSIDTILKFIYPPNLEHPEVNSRLDVFALYGPALNYHSVETCLCVPCGNVGKNYLLGVRRRKIQDEANTLGLNVKVDERMSLTTNQVGKVKISPIRLLDENGIQAVWNDLCDKCKEHCTSYVHMVSGREQQHILTDNEVRDMAHEVNKRDLLDLLIIEKGQAATIMIEDIPIIEPRDQIYDRHLIQELLKDVAQDYYERFDFSDVQQVILEDRRIRMNAWVGRIVQKQLDRFTNPKLLNQRVPEKERQNFKGPHFTLKRTQPLTYLYRKESITAKSPLFEPTLADKKKLEPAEEKIALSKKIQRNMHHIVSIDDINKAKDYPISLAIIRNYNEGRHGTWDNYATVSGNRVESFVKTQKFQKNKDAGL